MKSMIEKVSGYIRRKNREPRFLAKYYNFSLLFGIFFLMLSVYLFQMGYHSMDIAQNMRYIRAEYDLDIVEITSNGLELLPRDAWYIGSYQTRLSFIALIFGTSITTLSLDRLNRLIR